MDGDGTPEAADMRERQGLLECFERGPTQTRRKKMYKMSFGIS